MFIRHHHQAALVGLLGLSGPLLGCGPEDQIIDRQTQALYGCTPSISSGTAGINGTTPSLAFDRDPTTHFATGNNGWQYVQIDLGCAAPFTGLRRLITANGAANRVSQGEQVQYSSDGISWTYLTPSTSHGWSGYVAYNGNAWHSLPYGWSAWIRPNASLNVRYLRYRWDGNLDVLSEVEVDVRRVTSDQPAASGRTTDIVDGTTAAGFRSNYGDWQYLQIDYGEPVLVQRVRRHMSGGGGNRGLQGEQLLFSVDGAQWTYANTSNATGWGAYDYYAPNAWRQVTYGWSAWLTLNQPLTARYVRFRWDANLDTVNELEVDRHLDAGDPSYDFVPGSSAFSSAVTGYLAGLQLNPGGQSFSASRAIHRVGFTGTYDGHLYGLGDPGHSQAQATLTLIDDGTEARGELTLFDGQLQYLGGLICGTQNIAAGSVLAVRLSPWNSYDGRYSEWDSSYFPPGDARRFGQGATQRYVTSALASGDVNLNFKVMLQTSDVQGSWLVGDLSLDAPSVCADRSYTFVFKRRDSALANALGF